MSTRRQELQDRLTQRFRELASDAGCSVDWLVGEILDECVGVDKRLAVDPGQPMDYRIYRYTGNEPLNFEVDAEYLSDGTYVDGKLFSLVGGTVFQLLDSDVPVLRVLVPGVLREDDVRFLGSEFTKRIMGSMSVRLGTWRVCAVDFKTMAATFEERADFTSVGFM